MSPAVAFDIASQENLITPGMLSMEIDRRLGNVARYGGMTLVTNATDTVYALRDAPVVSGTLSGYPGLPTVDYENGTLLYATPPGAATYALVYQYRYWSSLQTLEALNRAIENLYPRFYAIGTETIATTGAGTYNCSSSVGVSDELMNVEYEMTSGYWLTLTGWRTVFEAATPRQVLVLEQPPPSGKFLRLTYAMRPATLFTTDVYSGANYIEETGLPRSARTPLVLLACADLVENRIARLSREDRGHNTQLEDVTTVEHLAGWARELRAAAEEAAERMRMPPPPSVRAVQQSEQEKSK